ncbi:polyketide synthase [Pseudoalteromonas sp. MMG013]|uniref:polyketide synthase n=1 Tax=Pseudoalteromonas sp. MMG013 TaxID=2822687 RepID=UPI001B384E82|nr:polyketide synthase [Pseudoalteromonas sp. MMG013]MBQ4863673.1 polyketide synthase [Pseudoalteromonas sp. MMG013]
MTLNNNTAIALIDCAHLIGSPKDGSLALLNDKKQYAKFAIPPIYRTAINRMQLPLLQLSSTLIDTHKGHINNDRTDVILCTHAGTDRQLANHYRLTANAMLRELMHLSCDKSASQLADLLPTELNSSHDKVGEMATTMATRIAQSCGLNGRSFAIEAANNSFAQAMALAFDSLRTEQTDSVLIAIANDIPNHSNTQRLGASVLLLKRCNKPIDNARGYLVNAFMCEKNRIVEHAKTQSSQSVVLCSITNAPLTEQLKPALHTHNINLDLRANILPDTGIVGSALVLNNWLKKPNNHTRALFFDTNEGHSAPSFTISRTFCPIAVNEAHAVVLCDHQIWMANRSGVTEYWQGLTDKTGGISSLIHDTYASGSLYHENGAQHDSYYCNAAAKLNTTHRDQLGQPSPKSVLAQTLKQWPSLDIPKHSRSMVITATNLGPYSERRKLLASKLKALCTQCYEILNGNNPNSSALTSLSEWQTQFNEDALSEDFQASNLSKQVAAHFALEDCQHLAIEAACAGSIAALDCAKNAIASGRIDVAIVAALELPVNLHDLSVCSNQQMLSRDVIATFCQTADGFTPGDGCAMVMLTTNTLAQKYDWPIKAELNAIGSSTLSKSMIAPNTEGQIQAMRHAFAQTFIKPSHIEFVETHGTGTPVGDSVEINAISSIYGARTHNQLKLGALKTQFGHTFAVAGLASIIKVLLSFEHNQIPRNLIRGDLHSDLQLSQLGYDPLNSNQAYSTPKGMRHATVNGFGTGGVNYHVIMSDFA